MVRYDVLTIFARFAVDILFAKLAVETKLARLAVLTKFDKVAGRFTFITNQTVPFEIKVTLP